MLSGMLMPWLVPPITNGCTSGVAVFASRLDDEPSVMQMTWPYRWLRLVAGVGAAHADEALGATPIGSRSASSGR